MRFFCLFVCLLSLLRAQAAISPSNPVVQAGKSITLTSSTPVAWTLTGTGTLSGITSTSAIYTAPYGIVARHQMLGCAVGTNDNIFNTRIDGLPVHPKSGAWINNAVNLFFFEKQNWGISYADASTPTRTLKTYYGPATYTNFAFPAGGPNLKRQNGNKVGTAGFTNPPDHHVMTVRRTDCTVYESYNDYMNGVTKTCQDGTSGCNVQSAMTYPAIGYPVKTGASKGTNAGGVPLAPTLWHVDEIESGTINHAIAFTANSASLLFGSYLWPAASSAGGCDPAICPNAMPLGVRLRLKAGFANATVCRSGVSTRDAACNTLLTALKQYGMILVDTGSANAALLSTDVTEDGAVAAAIEDIRASRMAFTNFEAVDESSLEVSSNSYRTCPFSWNCGGGVNVYEAPANQAVVTARPISGTSVSIPVAIQPVTIGLGVPLMVGIAAGNYSFQIPFWVNGSSNQSVQWKLLSGVGSVSSGGVYTPPTGTSSLAGLEGAVLQGTSAADSAAKVTLRLIVIPVTSAGVIRIDTGAAAASTDASGHVWTPDIGMDGGASSVASDYPHWNKSNPPASLVYESSQGSVSDIGSTIIVPNGNYDVHLLFGMPAGGACNVSCSTWLGYNNWWDQYNYAPYLLETQGQVKNASFNFGSVSSYKWQTPVDTHVAAAVTNHLLQVYVRSQTNDTAPYLTPQKLVQSKYTSLNGMEITPGAAATEPPSAPSGYWTINTQGQTSIAKGQTLKPFSVVDHGTGRNDPTWSVVSTPNGVTLIGSTLNLAANSSPNGVPIVVKASDGTYSATVSIATPAASSSAYTYRRQLTIPHGITASDLTDFPLTVSISDRTLADAANGGHVASPAGYDIVLATDAAGGNLLHWELESYNPSTGTWIAYVRIPKVSHTADTSIYLLYGGSAQAASKATATSAWNPGYTAVYHFGTAPVTVRDSTGNANSALTANVLYSSSGVIGGSVLTASANVQLPAKVVNQSAGTLSAWTSSLLPQDAYHTWYVASQPGATAKDFVRLGWSGADRQFEVVRSSASRALLRFGFPTTRLNFSNRQWNQVVYTWDAAAGVQNLYLNGTLIGSLSTKWTALSGPKALQLASDVSPSVSSLVGSLDEVRFSNTVRSADWVAAAFRNESALTTWVKVGAEIRN